MNAYLHNISQVAHPDDDLHIDFSNIEEKKMAFEQYKILVESINKINESREISNQFWFGVNGLGISAIAYLRDFQNITQQHKDFVLWTIILIGILLCLSWIKYLRTIKNSIVTRNKLLLKLEKNFPIPLFSKAFALSDEKPSKPALTISEMMVPYIFLVGYFFFAFLLLFFPTEVLSPIAHANGNS